MATQGLVTITNGKKVIMKIVAGCDGYHALKLVKAIKKVWPLTAEQTYKLAREINFGSQSCLVVMTEKEEVFKGDEDLSSAYRQTFNQPRFNPRWKHGTADNTVIIDLSEMKKKKGVKHGRQM